MGVKMPKKSKPQRPSRDEFELEELGNAVVEAHRENSEVLITLWQRDPVQGKIVKLDGQTQLIHIESGYDIIKVKFIDILSIKSAPE
ncbi:YolD-like family protein [Cytobacillus horneckiae]|uniref:YolD-like family protein n=1 Tax=Cytobacillus horneckiae TaxID=549687 RepID=UPI00203EC28C|nr:YolD-like family protein [Cytobacillus horneckiae]MCM3180789.1 YolD-like family protein [Cytobacillus horneckiae]